MPTLDELMNEFDPVDSPENVEAAQAKEEKQGVEVWNAVKDIGSKVHKYGPTAVADPDTPAGRTVVDFIEGGGEGLSQAVTNTANFAIETGDAIENALAELGVGSGDIIDEDSTFTNEYDENGSAAYQAGRLIGQYLTPFGAAIGAVNKFSKAGQIGKFGQATAAASVMSAAIVDPKDENLSNIVQTIPELANPVSEFLAIDPEDSALENRFKNAIESIIVDVLAGGAVWGGAKVGKWGLAKVAAGFTKALKLQKDARRAKKLVEEGAAIPDPPPAPKAGPEDVAGKAKPAKAAKPKKGKKPKKEKKKVKQEDVAKVIDPQGKSIDDIIKEVKKLGRKTTYEDLVQIVKRYKRSDEATAKMAREMAEDRENIEKLIRSKVPVTLADEEVVALANEVQATYVNFKAAMPKDIAKISKVERAAFLEAEAALTRVKLVLSAGKSEAGRTLRKVGVVKESIGKDEAIMDKYLQLLSGAESVEERLELFQRAEKIMGRKRAFSKWIEYAKVFGEAFRQTLYSNWLSGPETQLTNVVSNWFGQHSSLVEAAVAGRMDARIRGEATAMVHGYLDTLFEAMSVGTKIFKTGIVPPGYKTKIPLMKENVFKAENFGMQPSSPMGKIFDAWGFWVMNTPGRGLVSADAFFRLQNQRMGINRLAHRKTMAEMLSTGKDYGSKEYWEHFKQLTTDPKKEFIEEGMRLADENVLTRDLKHLGTVGKMAKRIESDLNSIPGGIGKIISPFMRVNVNLLNYKLQRLPILGLASPDSIRGLQAGLGSVKAKEVYAKQLIGFGITSVGASLTVAGVIKGNGPADLKLKRAINHESNTINGIKLSRLGVVGEIMGVSANFTEIYTHLDLNNEDAIDDLTASLGALMTSILLPSNISEDIPALMKAINDISTGKAGTGDKLSKAIADIAAMLSPVPANFLRQSRRLGDDTKYETRPQEHGGFISETWQRIVNEWKVTYGLTGDLTKAYNIFGESLHYPPGLMATIASPIFSNEPKDDLVEREIIRLEMAGKLVKGKQDPENKHLSLAMPMRTAKRGDEEMAFTFTADLTPEQYELYVLTAAGKGPFVGEGSPTLRETLTDVMESDGYIDASDEYKKILIHKVVEELRGVAREIIKQTPEDVIDKLYKSGPEKRQRALEGNN